MTAPAYTQQLVKRRNSGTPTDSVFVAVGWPSPWLREFVEKSPLCRHAVVLATPERRRYDFTVCVGLSVAIWVEKTEDEARANQTAEDVLKANPLRVFVMNVVMGETVFYKTASSRKAAA